MRFVVGPGAVAAAGTTAGDLAAQVGALELGSMGTLVAAGMPESVSAGLAIELSHRLAEELAALGAGLTVHAHELGLAADEYDAAEHAVGRAVVDRLGRAR